MNNKTFVITNDLHIEIKANDEEQAMEKFLVGLEEENQSTIENKLIDHLIIRENRC